MQRASAKGQHERPTRKANTAHTCSSSSSRWWLLTLIISYSLPVLLPSGTLESFDLPRRNQQLPVCKPAWRVCGREGGREPRTHSRISTGMRQRGREREKERERATYTQLPSRTQFHASKVLLTTAFTVHSCAKTYAVATAWSGKRESNALRRARALSLSLSLYI